jgi:hypothetical protein
MLVNTVSMAAIGKRLYILSGCDISLGRTRLMPETLSGFQPNMDIPRRTSRTKFNVSISTMNREADAVRYRTTSTAWLMFGPQVNQNTTDLCVSSYHG